MILNKHLSQRGKQGKWYLRVAVPVSLQGRWGKRERIKALGTSDRQIAEKLALPILAEWRHQEMLGLGKVGPSFDTPLSHHIPTTAELEEAAVILGHDLPLRDADLSRRAFGPGLLPYLSTLTRERLDEQQRHTATGDISLVRELADEAVAALGFNLAPDSEGYTKLCELLNVARLAGLRVDHQRNRGDLESETDSSLIRRVREREAATADLGETISELFEVYATQLLATRAKRPAGVSQDRMVIDQFGAFIGRNRTVSSIGYEDAKAFVDALEQWPAGYRKMAAYRGLSVADAIAKGHRDGKKTLSVITQQRYISTVSPFFSWLQSEKGGRRVKVNPFLGLHKDISKLKRGNPRPPFSAEQITEIINSPLFTGFLSDGHEHLPGDRHADDWRFWLPLICLFTGARIGEVSQLHIDDVSKERGIWCVELRHDASAGQQTKNNQSRTIALHSTLINIGLPEFVERQRKLADGKGSAQLFPDLQLGPRGQYGDKPSDWFRDYLKAIGVKVGDDGIGSHSFRHTMADQLRAAGHLDAVFGPLILGHSVGGPVVTGSYGQVRQGSVELSHSVIESVRFVPIHRGKVIENGTPVGFSHLMKRQVVRGLQTLPD